MTEFESPREPEVRDKAIIAEKGFDAFILTGPRRQMKLRAEALHDRATLTRAYEAVNAPTEHSYTVQDPQKQLTEIEKTVHDRINNQKTGTAYKAAYENAAIVVDSYRSWSTREDGTLWHDPYDQIFRELKYMENRQGRWMRSLKDILQKRTSQP